MDEEFYREAFIQDMRCIATKIDSEPNAYAPASKWVAKAMQSRLIMKYAMRNPMTLKQAKLGSYQTEIYDLLEYIERLEIEVTMLVETLHAD